jgi:hypothetical protein
MLVCGEARYNWLSAARGKSRHEIGIARCLFPRPLRHACRTKSRLVKPTVLLPGSTELSAKPTPTGSGCSTRTLRSPHSNPVLPAPAGTPRCVPLAYARELHFLVMMLAIGRQHDADAPFLDALGISPGKNLTVGSRYSLRSVTITSERADHRVIAMPSGVSALPDAWP